MIHLLARVTFRLLISHRFLLRQSGEGLKTHGMRDARGWFQPSRTEYIIHNVVVTMVVICSSSALHSVHLPFLPRDP